MDIRIFPPEDMIDGAVNLPLSKSVMNRRMIIDHLAGMTLPDVDTQVCGTDIATMHAALTAASKGTVNVGDAGTAMRFLTALYAATEGCDITLTGSERMQQRPIGPLVEALRRCGADISYTNREGFPPLHITGCRLAGGTAIEVDASVSSQFISALLLVAPAMNGGLTVELEGPVKSRPYIDLTLKMMQERGIEADVDANTITVPSGKYNQINQPDEYDWSAVAFWAELTAVTAGFIFLRGINPESNQGDKLVLQLFANLGVAIGEPDDESEYGEGMQLCGSPDISPRLNYNFAECPDLAQAAAVACCLIGVPFHFTGLETLAIKETHRIEALITEMEKIGIRLSSASAGSLDWEGERMPVTALPEFDSHADHRMAMALAPVAAFIPGMVIRNDECVDKSYPGFWHELQELGFRFTDADEPYNPEEEQ